MYNTIIVEVLKCITQLETDLFDSPFFQLEIASFNVVKQITASHVIEYNIVVVTVLKDVYESDDVGVLTHLEHLDLSSLLEHLDGFHVFLLDSLDGHLEFSLHVGS